MEGVAYRNDAMEEVRVDCGGDGEEVGSILESDSIEFLVWSYLFFMIDDFN
jgi:hypothetical protein